MNVPHYKRAADGRWVAEGTPEYEAIRQEGLRWLEKHLEQARQEVST